MFREGAVLSRGPALKAQKHRISRCPYFANDFKTPNSSAFRILVEKRTRSRGVSSVRCRKEHLYYLILKRSVAKSLR